VNFGWNLMEGLSCFSTNPCNQPSSTLPVLDYDHSANACAVVGGTCTRHRDRGSPGHVLLWRLLRGLRAELPLLGGQVTEETSWPSLQANGLTSFGEDSAGELYLMTDNGDVQKIVSN
jgi:hypothetical protein